MIPRHLTTALARSASQYPVVTLTGPRQSGKTTLVQTAFPNHAYASLEEPDLRSYALEDPRGFLAQFSGPVVLDEVQRVPDLFSYIQTIVDREDVPGRFILTGSQNFLLLRSVSQSLAGRCAILHLLPFSLSELEHREPFPISSLGRGLPPDPRAADRNLMDVMFSGFYPRIHDRNIDPSEWLRNYYLTYAERDVRDIVNVGDIETFGRFVRLCAGRNGLLLNLSSLGADCGISHMTAKRWLSILEASFLVMLLRPHHRSFNKRLIKTPKLYFLDPGLLCYLLRIRSSEDLHLHASRGAIFETLVVTELLKNYLHRGEEPFLYFWRDSAGHEIDVIIELGDSLLPIEVKSGQTVASDFFSGLRFWRELTASPDAPAALIYGGDRSYVRNGISVYAWSCL